MRMRPLITLLVVPAFAGCSLRPMPKSENPPVLSGNPVRDFYASELHDFKQRQLPKAEVLSRVGGIATQVKAPADLENLPHSELSTITVPPETLAEWKREYEISAETYHVMAEGGNDMILYFDSTGRLRDYVHF